MTKCKKKVLSLLVVALFLVTSFICFGCSEKQNALSIGSSTISVSSGATLETVLSSVTLTYDEGNDGEDVETFEGLAQMRAAGVSVIWSGSDVESGSISFAYKGNVLSVDYTVGGTTNPQPTKHDFQGEEGGDCTYQGCGKKASDKSVHN